MSCPGKHEVLLRIDHLTAKYSCFLEPTKNLLINLYIFPNFKKCKFDLKTIKGHLLAFSCHSCYNCYMNHSCDKIDFTNFKTRNAHKTRLRSFHLVHAILNQVQDLAYFASTYPNLFAVFPESSSKSRSSHIFANSHRFSSANEPDTCSEHLLHSTEHKNTVSIINLFGFNK